MLLQPGGINDLHHFAGFFHGPIPRKLALRLGPGNLRAVPTRQRIAGPDVATNLRRDAKPDLAATHIRQRHGAARSIDPIGPAGFATPNVGHRLREVAIPFQSIHAQVEVSVEDQHGGI
ncbi:MAG: hypothetical protein QM775_30570 [Pirellulales bacterium]